VTEGFLYIATGEEFVKEAKISVQRLQEVMEGYPCSIVTDININYPLFDKVIAIDDATHNSGDQIRNLTQTPYDKTIYIDTDIYINSDISEIYSVLDEYDLALPLSQNRLNSRVENEEIPDCFVEYNTGLVAYNNTSDLKQLCSIWEDLYIQNKNQDNWPNQPAFREAIYKSDLQVATLPPEYHLVIRQPGHVKGEVKVAHGRLLEVGHLSGGGRKTMDVPTAVKKLNRINCHRTYTLGYGKIRVHTNSKFLYLQRSLISQGFKGTTKKILNKINPLE